MMYSKFCAFILLAVGFLASGSDAQACSPRSVQNLTVSAHHILSWTVRADDPCLITEFLVQIWQIGYPIEYTFSVNETQADVSFLESCEEWTFVVTPISFYTSGAARRIIQNLPLPADANITVAYLNASHIEGTNDVHLHWDLADRRYGNCSIQYRLTIEQDGSPTLEDLYIEATTLDLHFLSPCTAYQFTVRAINIGHPTVEGPARIALHTMPAFRQGFPTLIELDATATSVNTTWRLQSYARNPCRVSEFRVDDVNGAFNIYLPLEDSRLRYPVNVTLDSLEPNHLYTVRAYVRNTAGWSAPAEVIFETRESMKNKEIE